MKCPYNVSKKTVTQSNSSINNSQDQSSSIVTQIESFSFSDCWESECAAWDKESGKCLFNNDTE